MIRISNYEFQWPFSCSFCRWFLIHFFTNDRRLIPKPCESQSIKSAIRVTASLPTWPQQKGHRGSKAPQGEHGAGTSDLMVSHQTKPPHWRHLQIFAQHGDTHDIPFFLFGMLEISTMIYVRRTSFLRMVYPCLSLDTSWYIYRIQRLHRTANIAGGHLELGLSWGFILETYAS